MGAVNFYEVKEGVSPENAFKELVSDARREYGEDPYSGTIATTFLVSDGVVKIASRYSRSAEERGEAYAKEENYGQKWESRCLDLGITKYIIRNIEKKKVDPAVGAPVYKIEYVLLLPDYHFAPVFNDKSFSTLKEAEETAAKYAVQSGFSISIHKRKTLIAGSDATEEIRVVTTETKTKPKKLPKGAVLTEVHMYGFYGRAAC